MDPKDYPFLVRFPRVDLAEFLREADRRDVKLGAPPPPLPEPRRYRRELSGDPVRVLIGPFVFILVAVACAAYFAGVVRLFGPWGAP